MARLRPVTAKPATVVNPDRRWFSSPDQTPFRFPPSVNRPTTTIFWWWRTTAATPPPQAAALWWVVPVKTSKKEEDRSLGPAVGALDRRSEPRPVGLFHYPMDSRR
ncbi:hypothetical protein HanXRQr2_Chr12g0555021 [Helianthus annuus]|uniref:Uncharacterized protein n=1 Tax=Helianthus annuus TaxID=4232 RepID=A0A9K3HIP5_HELAN|nr:hypothetical protein HanXRQr2_Chr12g0555021 [Helianthus annuus]KAJ0863812.1 hypothetical protein HanPSC8_Chr12g0534391 [Helianthus annuus]